MKHNLVNTRPKIYLVITLLLLSGLGSSLSACGFYPYGEDVRFSLIKTDSLGYLGFTPFCYSSNWLHSYEYPETESPEQNENKRLWRDRCRQQVSLTDIGLAIYTDSFDIKDKHSANKFIRYLHSHHDTLAIDYLDFAKEAQIYTSNSRDSWVNEITRSYHWWTLIARAVDKVNNLKDQDIRFRYKFIATRLAHFDEKHKLAKALYNLCVKPKREWNVLDYGAYFFANHLSADNTVETYDLNDFIETYYFEVPEQPFWPIAIESVHSRPFRPTVLLKSQHSLFVRLFLVQKKIFYWQAETFTNNEFMLVTDPELGYDNSQSAMNFRHAIVFEGSSDKRQPAKEYYDTKIPIGQTLSHAKNGQERAAVWFIDAVCKPGQAFGHLQAIYRNEPKSEKLSLTLLREVNKLEDWILTPSYAHFSPSVRGDNWYDDPYPLMRKRVAKDKVYAKKVLAFVKSVDLSKVENHAIWKIAKASIEHMIGQTDAASKTISQLEAELSPQHKAFKTVHMLKVLYATGAQPQGAAVILPEAEPVLMAAHKQKNLKFIFAMGRELERKGNTIDAALVYSTLDQYKYDYALYRPVWKAPMLEVGGSDFYSNYFDYIDAKYTPVQIENLIDRIKQNKSTSRFDKFLFKWVKKDLHRLNDLAGIKFFRQNKLSDALKHFRKNEGLNLKEFEFDDVIIPLPANPFYTNFYNERKKTAGDTISYTKAKLIKTLIQYLEKAENPKEKDRDYYYFLVANCYLNTSKNGNSWMMRRYYRGHGHFYNGLVDDDDYFQCRLASEYYIKASKTTKSQPFAVLCLRMAARCESHKMYAERSLSSELEWSQGKTYNYPVKTNVQFRPNKYYQQIKKQYPSYYDEVVSNCYSFNELLKERKFRW
jgi:hypothetical protein